MSELLNPRNSGYLRENFRLFHLRDQLAPKVESHYHEFDKILVHFSGTVDYIIEGACYSLHAGDILFVRHHEIHRPQISPEQPYDRAVLWIAPEYLESLSTPQTPLARCFDLAVSRKSCLWRPDRERFHAIKKLLSSLEAALQETDFGSEMLAESLFVQFMICCNRLMLSEHPQTAGTVDPKIEEALSYIALHLSEPLNVDMIAARCYMSRYHFMRRFKEATGYTVHGYIQQKRLLSAAEKLEDGMGVCQAAAECGFFEYSTFLRAFRKAFHLTPTDYLREKHRLDSCFSE